MMARLRAVPRAFRIGVLVGLSSTLSLILVLLLPVTFLAQRLQRPVIVAQTAYATYPDPVCPGDLVVFEYRAQRLQAGNQNLVAVSNWYNPATKTRYATAPSVYGAIFPEGTTVIRSLTEVRVPETLPAGPNQYWRAIAGQPGSLFRIDVNVVAPEQCPATEIGEQEER